MRTYSEDEVRAIIARAVERQHDAEAGAAATGLTLGEIERLGRESGIDPAHLRAAASEIDTAGRTLSRQREQTRTEVVVERWVEAPLTPEGWEDVVARMREDRGAPMSALVGSDAGDTVRQVGSSYEWVHTDGLGVRTRVTASPRDGRTRLRMTQLVGHGSPRTEGIAYGGMIAAFLAVLVAGAAAALGEGLLDPTLTGFVAFVVLWLAAAPAVTALDRRWRARMLRKLDALADDAVGILQARAPRDRAPAGPAEDGVPTAEPPQIDLDALDLDAFSDAPDAEAASERRRTRA